MGPVRALLTSPIVRRLALVVLLLAIPLIALAAADDGGGIDVVDVSGPLDEAALEFMIDAIGDATATGQELVVLQVDSKAVLDGDSFDTLYKLVQNPPVPVAVWLGPAPAAAYGGAGLLTLIADPAAAAPGSTLGILDPVVTGGDHAVPPGAGNLATETSPVEGLDLELQPSLRQFLQELDGESAPTSNGPVTLATVEPFEGGVTVKPVTFRKPDLITRFFRLAVTPEAAFFFLVIGLSLVTFEFFALGPGVASAVAAVSLLLGGWGIVTLPVRWWAVGLVVLGWFLLTSAYQKGGFVVMTAAGAIVLQTAGTFLVAGSGQIDSRWWLILPSVLAVLFFFLIAMPTVQRSRLSTETIGRDSLIGHRGRALVGFDPDGVVEVNGARWRATAHREAGLIEGMEVVVTGVDGLYLEVDPVETGRET